MCCRKATSVDASAILLARRKRHFATGSNMASSSSSSSLKRNANVNANAKQVRGGGGGAQRELCLATCHARCCTYLYVYIFLRFINFYISLASTVFSPGFYGVNFTTFYAVKVAVNRAVLQQGDRGGGGGDKLELQQSSAGFGLCGAHKFPFRCIVPLVPH